MSRHGRLNHSIRWAALLALLLATLAPSVAHALRHARGETMPWSLLCSATGGKRVVFETPAGDPGSAPPAHAFEHCASCAVHHDGHAPAPATPLAAAMLRSDLAHALPALPLNASLPAQAWLGAQPRAPPTQA